MSNQKFGENFKLLRFKSFPVFLLNRESYTGDQTLNKQNEMEAKCKLDKTKLNTGQHVSSLLK